MVSEIHHNVELIFSVKNLIELEADLSLRELKFKSLNRSVPVFPLNKEVVKPNFR